MHIIAHHPDDLTELDGRIRVENNAAQHDRLRVVRLALGGLQEPVIRVMLGRSRDFVQKWAYAYRDGGLDAIATKPRPGRPTKLPREQEEALRQRDTIASSSRHLAIVVLADPALIRARPATRIVQAIAFESVLKVLGHQNPGIEAETQATLGAGEISSKRVFDPVIIE